MLNHDYFGELTNLTGTIWQNYVMIDKMPIAVNLINDSKFIPTFNGLNRYAFACHHLTDFDKNNRLAIFEILRNNNEFMQDFIDDNEIFEEWKNSRYGIKTDDYLSDIDDYYFGDALINRTHNQQSLALQEIFVYFEGNETDGYIQFNYQVYPHLEWDKKADLLWIKTDLTGNILQSVWENNFFA